MHQNIIDGLDKDFLEDDNNLIEDNLNNDYNENNNCDNENDKEETGRGIINYNVEDLAKEFVDKWRYIFFWQFYPNFAIFFGQFCPNFVLCNFFIWNFVQTSYFLGLN